jgi:hypothetical protein
MTASVGVRIVGAGRSSKRTSPGLEADVAGLIEDGGVHGRVPFVMARDSNMRPCVFHRKPPNRDGLFSHG